MVNRELAILLTHFRRTKVLEGPVHTALLEALQASKGDREQQIHYFYCLRLLHEGWTAEQKQALAAWYDSTRDWRGGASFGGFLQNIFRECLTAYTLADRRALLEKGEKLPRAARAVARQAQDDRQTELLPALKALASRLAKLPKLPHGRETRSAVGDAVLRLICEAPRNEDFNDLVK